MLGASGYTGEEVVRLLALHPNFSVAALTGESQAGKASTFALTRIHMLQSHAPRSFLQFAMAWKKGRGLPYLGRQSVAYTFNV